jgi:hypothetical protein
MTGESPKRILVRVCKSISQLADISCRARNSWALTCIACEGGSLLMEIRMPEAKPSHLDQATSHSCMPDEGLNCSDFEDLLRRTSEVLGARARVERGRVGTENSKLQD